MELVEVAFGELNLDWHDYVKFDKAFGRPSDISRSHADPARAHAKLAWKARFTMPDVVRMMLKAETASLQLSAR
jgi:GDPmannose 4,6-dehydratase